MCCCALSSTTAARVFAFVSLVVVNLILCGYLIITSNAFASSTVHPAVYNFLATSISTSLFVAWAIICELRWVEAKDRALLPRPEHYGHFVVVGALIYGGQIGFSVLSLKLISATTASIFAPMTPALGLFLSFAAGSEAFNCSSVLVWVRVFGAVLALTGGVLIAVLSEYTSLGAGAAPSVNLPVGVVFLFSSRTCTALSSLIQKPLFPLYRTHLVIAWASVCAWVCVFAQVVPVAATAAHWAVGGRAVLLGIFFSAVVMFFLGFLLLALANKILTPVVVSTSYALSAVMGPLLSYTLLGAAVSDAQYIGGSIVVAGILVMAAAQLWGGRFVDVPVGPADEEGGAADAATAAAAAEAAGGGEASFASPGREGSMASVAPLLLRSEGSGKSFERVASQRSFARRQVSRIFLSEGESSQSTSLAL